MTHLVVVDYAYITVKKFFGSLEEAHGYVPHSVASSSYQRALNKKIYELKGYTGDTKYDINFDKGLIP